MDIYLVRHGQTNYNILNLVNDDPKVDVYLTELGKKQADEVKEKLKDITFDAVFVSELKRTHQTANIITNNQEYIIDKRLNDRKTGLEGKSVDLFREMINNSNDKWNYKINDGESFEEEKKRVIDFLKDLQKKDYNTVLIVGHKEINQIINGYFNNLNNEEARKVEIDNCKVLEFKKVF